MASHNNKISKLLKEQRSRKPQQQQTSVNYIVSLHANSDQNLSANVPLGLCEPLRHKKTTILRNRKWGNCYVAGQYITSMLILLATVQAVMSQQLLRAAADDVSEVVTTLNESTSNTNLTHSATEHLTEETMNETISNTNNNQILNSTHYKKFIAEIPGAGVSLNRNSLMRADNVLQRQLREKAKKDSLESIKMHILLRLNLKKLPNITKPITVPQNILENFYKNYNASSPLYSAPINNPSSDTPPPARTDLYASDEIHNEPTKKSITEPTLSNEKLFAEMQGDDPGVYDEKLNVGKTNNYGFSNLNYDGEYESILSHISSIYIFPERK